MSMPDTSCSFSMLAGPRDTDFLGPIARHLIKQHPGVFQDRILVVDDLPSQLPNDLRIKFQELCDELVQAHLFTSLYRLSQISSTSQIARKHFESEPSYLRDFRGVPLFGWIAGIEASSSRYHVHCDSDILIYQKADFSWVAEGIRLIERGGMYCAWPRIPAHRGSMVGFWIRLQPLF